MTFEAVQSEQAIKTEKVLGLESEDHIQTLLESFLAMCL